MSKTSVNLLKSLCEAHSVPGYEDEVRQIFASELQDRGQLYTDGSGSVFCENGEGPRVMVAGHMDEVGFRVQNITRDGFLQFVTLGGWWSHTLLSQRVVVKNRAGQKVLGVISSKPPHFLSAEARNRVMDTSEMFIDIGACSQQEAVERYGISLGDPICPQSEFTQLANPDLFMAKAFDNRVGMACAIEVAAQLDEHPNCLVACGTVQEELGLRGAKTAAAKAKPDVVIVLEGPPADDTPGFNPADSQGRLGGGVQIRMHDPSAMMNPKLVDFAVSTAVAEGIPYQVTVRTSGGTDAGSFHLAEQGIPCIVLGVPSRYIHSHNGIININDYQDMLRLAKAMVRGLDQGAVDQLTTYL